MENYYKIYKIVDDAIVEYTSTVYTTREQAARSKAFRNDLVVLEANSDGSPKMGHFTSVADGVRATLRC